MRQAILSEFEREILKAYLKDGSIINPNAFWVLQNRIRKNIKTLQKDMNLIESFLKKRET
jgi:hypothetical protein